MPTVPRGPRTRGTLSDLVALLALPAFLFVLHVSAPAARDGFALRYGDPSVVSLWASAFVHASDAHLYSNLVGYTLAVVPTYLLYFHWGRTRAFWASVAVAVVFVPPVVNLGSYAYFDSLGIVETTVSRGFSGVVAAFAGGGLAAVVTFVADEYGLRRAYWFGQTLVLTVGGVLLVALTDVVEPWQLGIVGVGVVLSLGGLLAEESAPLAGLRADSTTVVVLAYVTMALLFVVYQLFPADPVRTGSVTNLVAHAVGLVAGVLLPGSGLVLTGSGAD
ncbi:hypothetical protein [Haloarchaeobius sp. TZWWS8]|uniref:hypothetical protein n=1 Tax=Haloarchaeobius sp. TZWWS8 TaxID=3446121 RepID=UPI003EBEA122